jgi:hypothetical protein
MSLGPNEGSAQIRLGRRGLQTLAWRGRVGLPKAVRGRVAAVPPKQPSALPRMRGRGPQSPLPAR